MSQRPRVEDAAREDPREWVQAALLMIEDGFPATLTADAVGVPRQRLYDALSPSSARARSSKKYGPTCTRCGKTTRGRGPDAVCRTCRRRHDELILMLWNQGLDRNEISERTGLLPRYISTRITHIRDRGLHVIDHDWRGKYGRGQRPARPSA